MERQDWNGRPCRCWPDGGPLTAKEQLATLVEWGQTIERRSNENGRDKRMKPVSGALAGNAQPLARPRLDRPGSRTQIRLRRALASQRAAVWASRRIAGSLPDGAGRGDLTMVRFRKILQSAGHPSWAAGAILLLCLVCGACGADDGVDEASEAAQPLAVTGALATELCTALEQQGFCGQCGTRGTRETGQAVDASTTSPSPDVGRLIAAIPFARAACDGVDLQGDPLDCGQETTEEAPFVEIDLSAGEFDLWSGDWPVPLPAADWHENYEPMLAVARELSPLLGIADAEAFEQPLTLSSMSMDREGNTTSSVTAVVVRVDRALNGVGVLGERMHFTFAPNGNELEQIQGRWTRVDHARTQFALAQALQPTAESVIRQLAEQGVDGPLEECTIQPFYQLDAGVLDLRLEVYRGRSGYSADI